MEYVEYTSKLSGQWLQCLLSGSPRAEPFDSTYRKYMEDCISKKRLLKALTHSYSSAPEALKLINDELRAVEDAMDIGSLRKGKVITELMENNYAWRVTLPWLEKQKGMLQVERINRRDKRAKRRKQALDEAISAIKYDYASQRDVEKILKISRPRPYKDNGELTEHQAFHNVILMIRSAVQEKGRKGSPTDIINYIKRNQGGDQNPEDGIEIEESGCSDLRYSEKDNKLWFTNANGRRTSRSPFSLNRIIYPPEE